MIQKSFHVRSVASQDNLLQTFVETVANSSVKHASTHTVSGRRSPTMRWSAFNSYRPMLRNYFHQRRSPSTAHSTKARSLSSIVRPVKNSLASNAPSTNIVDHNTTTTWSLTLLTDTKQTSQHPYSQLIYYAVPSS